jgi:transcriptional regulator with XRE-family HTH domain
MNTDSKPLKLIGERLKGLRESLDLSVGDVARSCHLSPDVYRAYEAGEHDLSVSTLNAIAQYMGVGLSVLMFGEEPKVASYFITRRGKGLAVERVKAYSYQALGAGFIDKKVQPFLVAVEPKHNDAPIHLNTHPGQEFNLILEGRMQIQINGKDLILDEGDSIYFDSSQPHGMKALDGRTVKFLAIII